MTPEELEALAGRAETGTATVIDVARAIGHRAWVDGPTPNYFTSLDAAAQVMPPNWAVRIDTWPGGNIDVTVRECVPRPDIDGGLWHSTRDGEALGSAPTECAARVAAGLRARAHVLRNGGAA